MFLTDPGLSARDGVQDIAVATGDFDGTVVDDKNTKLFQLFGPANQVSRVIQKLVGVTIFTNTKTGITFEPVTVAKKRQATGDGCRFRRAGGD